MTPDELREAAAIARRMREGQIQRRRELNRKMREEMMRQKLPDRLANLGPAGRRKLTPDAVRRIRIRVQAGEKLEAVGIDFGVTAQCVCMVARGQRWKEVAP